MGDYKCCWWVRFMVVILSIVVLENFDWDGLRENEKWRSRDSK